MCGHSISVNVLSSISTVDTTTISRLDELPQCTLSPLTVAFPPLAFPGTQNIHNPHIVAARAKTNEHQVAAPTPAQPETVPLGSDERTDLFCSEVQWIKLPEKDIPSIPPPPWQPELPTDAFTDGTTAASWEILAVTDCLSLYEERMSLRNRSWIQSGIGWSPKIHRAFGKSKCDELQWRSFKVGRLILTFLSFISSLLWAAVTKGQTAVTADWNLGLLGQRSRSRKFGGKCVKKF